MFGKVFQVFQGVSIVGLRLRRFGLFQLRYGGSRCVGGVGRCQWRRVRGFLGCRTGLGFILCGGIVGVLMGFYNQICSLEGFFRLGCWVEKRSQGRSGSRESSGVSRVSRERRGWWRGREQGSRDIVAFCILQGSVITFGLGWS